MGVRNFRSHPVPPLSIIHPPSQKQNIFFFLATPFYILQHASCFNSNHNPIHRFGITTCISSLLMASKHPIPSHILSLSNEFRSHILKLDLKSTLNNPNSSTFSSSITDTASSSFELCEEDYIDKNNPKTTSTINHLREIAMKMNSAGYLQDCIIIYTSERSSAMAASLQRLKVQKLSQRKTLTLDWVSLESIIRDWNRSAIICIKFLFLNEKRICHQIFHGFQNAIDDDCFIKTVKEPATLLFDVAESLCSVHPSSEKLFRFLDLYQTLLTILPFVNNLFNSESSECIRVRPSQLLVKLAELIRHILSAFENDVLKDQSPTPPVPEIHRLPRYVMNHVCKMCDYKQVLTELIISKPSTDEDLAELGQTLFSQHQIWIVMLLLSNLETKSKFYEASSMASFFMMINLHYAVRKIEGNPVLKDLIGDGYLKKLNRKLRQVKNGYLGLVFNKILDCLRTEGLNGSGMFSSKAKKMIKRLNSFNAGFEKAQKDLANLVIPDSQLLEDVRKTIKELFIPAYTSFLEQLKSVRGSGKHSAEVHVKYSVKDLEAAILNLFKKPI